MPTWPTIAVALATLAALGLSCGRPRAHDVTTPPPDLVQDPMTAQREAMVRTQIAARGIADEAVLAALRRVPRHLFVPPGLQDDAYADSPLPIGHDQTISQPYIVAYMSEALRIGKEHRVLEVGTGSGYQAAVLGELAGEVYTIEIVAALGDQATALLGRLGYRNVHVRVGDGYLGWPERAPFDRIIVTAAPTHVPPPLVEQLAVGGIMVLPVGDWHQEMVTITRSAQGVVERRTIPVRFVPLRRSPVP